MLMLICHVVLKVHSSPHETPDLSLVGWFTLVPSSGPGLEQAESQFALYTHYKTPLILLGFHPSSSLGLGGSLRGKFPLTIYDATCPDPDLDTQQVGVSSEVRFSEVPYSIETGEAEMIGLAYVSKGGGNATAVETVKKSAPVDKAAVQKGKKKAGNEESQEADSARAEEQNVLSREEEELIASLTTKANAIKMLQSRIDLITKYLELLPPSYITSDSSAMESEADGNQTSVNYSILRSIKAMLHRLSLLIPSDNISFNQELLSEKNDVNLVNLLSTLTQSIESSRELGRKFAIVDHARHLWRSGAKKMGASSQSDLENDRWGREYSSSAISGVGDLMS